VLQIRFSQGYSIGKSTELGFKDPFKVLDERQE